MYIASIYINFMVNKSSSGFDSIWQYLSALYLFGNGYQFYLFFLLKITPPNIV